jgi:hypothetical protein
MHRLFALYRIRRAAPPAVRCRPAALAKEKALP